MKKATDIGRGEIVIYKADDGSTSLDVRLDGQTVWLTQDQMAALFGRERSVISKHIGNVFKSRELEKKSNVQKMHIPPSDKPVGLFSLDVIISVGYRVNSRCGVQFRIWATNVLREHLVKGYTLYRKRLQENQARMKDLEGAIELVKSAQETRQLTASEAAGLLTVITDYARSWLLLQRYDEDKLPVKELSQGALYELTEEEAQKAIEGLRHELKQKKEAGDLFGRENAQDKLKGILGNISQTFGGKDLYPSIEEKAAHLLYFIIKDHPLVDGNKRVGSLLFVWFLDRNRYLLNTKGERKINDNALVALALLVAESNPKHKELMIKLIINLVSGNQ